MMILAHSDILAIFLEYQKIGGHSLWRAVALSVYTKGIIFIHLVYSTFDDMRSKNKVLFLTEGQEHSFSSTTVCNNAWPLQSQSKGLI